MNRKTDSVYFLHDELEKGACPYFFHLGCSSPNFSSSTFLNGYSWTTPAYIALSPMLQRFLHVVESSTRAREAAAAQTWELSERKGMTQICPLAR